MTNINSLRALDESGLKSVREFLLKGDKFSIATDMEKKEDFDLVSLAKDLKKIDEVCDAGYEEFVVKRVSSAGGPKQARFFFFVPSITLITPLSHTPFPLSFLSPRFPAAWISNGIHTLNSVRKGQGQAGSGEEDTRKATSDMTAEALITAQHMPSSSSSSSSSPAGGSKHGSAGKGQGQATAEGGGSSGDGSTLSRSCVFSWLDLLTEELTPFKKDARGMSNNTFALCLCWVAGIAAADRCPTNVDIDITDYELPDCGKGPKDKDIVLYMLHRGNFLRAFALAHYKRPVLSTGRRKVASSNGKRPGVAFDEATFRRTVDILAAAWKKEDGGLYPVSWELSRAIVKVRSLYYHPPYYHPRYYHPHQSYPRPTLHHPRLRLLRFSRTKSPIKPSCLPS